MRRTLVRFLLALLLAYTTTTLLLALRDRWRAVPSEAVRANTFVCTAPTDSLNF